ncbi:Translocase of chloroplast 90, chloroplastic [Apostasia shenzhenica]|uniref:Translocase of chloroplast 90, chloroplastic n=1 Tax=Apostasia shenzhenica TaxID=1088818 RepID=A0A2I0AM84_9ASPA|nr:Translocase of chloroplast 90, chloroplastic [Apostasia shenzhenica]
MMKSFKEWLYSHSVSKSLLSVRPFSFFYDEPQDDEVGSRGAADLVRGDLISPESPHSSDGQANETSSHVPIRVAETTQLYLQNYYKRNKDPLSQVEAFQISFLRLVQRIGQSANPIVARVLYRLELGSLIRAGESDLKRPSLKVDSARAIASTLEELSQDDLDFSIRILLLGKTGVGKSATINSLFDQARVVTSAYQPATEKIQQVFGSIEGIKVTVIDTPGLLPSNNNQRRNRKILHGIKKFIRRSPPDVVLYFERLDLFNRGSSDFPLLKLITDVFGSSIWFNTVLVMTHSWSPLPEGLDSFPMNYESFVGQCRNLLQYYIHRAISNTQLENPIILVENHPMCMRNSKGEKVLPDGQIWLSQLLFLCIATKTLGDANSILKFHDSFQLLHSIATRQPSLPHLLSSLLQPRSSLATVGGYDAQVDDQSDNEEDEYDQLPLIRILTKTQFQKLSRSQKNAYLDELEYRETLYLKKQWRTELKMHKESKLQNTDFSENGVSHEVVQLPDMAIPLSFDSEHPSHRYRCIVGGDQWLIRPVLDSQGWDHDVGFDGISLELAKEVKKCLPFSVVGQMNKDKNNFSIQSECVVNFIHQKGHLLSGLDVQTASKDLICTFRGDAVLRNLRYNNTGCGLSLTSFGKTHFIGAKLEDSILLGRRFKMMANTGRVVGNGQVAHGGSLEATLRGKDYPVRDEKVILAATILSFDNDMVMGGSLQTDFRVGHVGKMSFSANMNSRSLGQISFKYSTSEHIELGLIAVITLLQGFFHRRKAYTFEWEKS